MLTNVFISLMWKTKLLFPFIKQIYFDKRYYRLKQFVELFLSLLLFSIVHDTDSWERRTILIPCQDNIMFRNQSNHFTAKWSLEFSSVCTILD